MASDIQDLDIIDANNNINWPEGSMVVKNVNNAGRADEGMLARWFADWNGSKTTTGSGSAYAVSSDTNPGAYYAGFTMVVTIHAASEDDATLNVDTINAHGIMVGNRNIAKDDLKIGAVARFVHDGVSTWQLAGQSLPPVGTDIGDLVQLEDVSGSAALPEVDGSQLTGISGFVSGDVKMAAYTATPAGWLLCDGAAVSRTTYADLFAAIGTTFGTGDGSTTFNVPDMRGRGPIGVGQGDTAEGGGTGTARALGDEGGAETHTQTEAELVGHIHQQRGHNGAGGFSANVVQGGASARDSAYNDGNTASTGSGDPMNNMQPFNTLNFFIKT